MIDIFSLILISLQQKLQTKRQWSLIVLN